MITLPYNFDLTQRPYQFKVLDDPRKNKVLILHRRAGKTSLALNKIIYDSMFPGNRGKVYYYVCPTQRQAKEIVWKAPDMLERYLPREFIDTTNEVELTIYLKEFNNGGQTIGGGQIRIKGADNPDSLRGTNPYGLILDEYAQIKPEVYNEIFRPVLAANNGWVWFIGTPKGKDDLYFKYCYALNHPTSWQPFLLKASESKIILGSQLEEARKEMTQQSYAQEFECEFLEGAGTIFRRIRENIFGHFEEPKKGHSYKIGIDLGRHQDFTVIVVIDRHEHRIVYFDRFSNVDWQLQKARIEAVARRYNNAPITIDSTGVGDPISEDLRRLGLVINDFKFTNVSKKNLIENLALMIEQNKVTYPEIIELIRELEEFTYELLPGGKIRYTAPQGLHDDTVCFVKGTQILTNKGQVPIEKIKVGDLVMTRIGLKPVIKIGNRYEKVINKLGLAGTPDHPIITAEGIIPLGKVKVHDNIYIWNEKLLSIEEKSITDTLIQKGVNCESIIGGMISGRVHPLLFIGKFGLIIMELYQRIMLFIIKTITLLITPLIILLPCPGGNMLQNICLRQKEENYQAKQAEKILRRPGRDLTNGRERKKGSGALGLMLIRLFLVQNKKENVFNVIRSLFLLLKGKSNFVENCAGIVTGRRKVYNLQVADQPEYIANNILVHNCAFALACWQIGEKIPLIHNAGNYGLDFNLRSGYKKLVFR